MTKTFAAVLSHHCPNLCPPVIMLFTQMLTDYVFGILNLDHCNLFDIWFLVLEIFLIFIWIFQYTHLAFPELPA